MTKHKGKPKRKSQQPRKRRTARNQHKHDKVTGFASRKLQRVKYFKSL